MKPRVKKQVQNRLKRIEGQVRGVQKMVAQDTYCIKVIHQLSAICQALSAVENAMLENHLLTHVIEQIGTQDQKRTIKEILSIYKIAKKK